MEDEKTLRDATEVETVEVSLHSFSSTSCSDPKHGYLYGERRVKINKEIYESLQRCLKQSAIYGKRLLAIEIK